MTNFLKYGDKVIVQSSMTHKEKQIWGFLAAEGFFNDKLVFEQLSEKEEGHKNLRENIFELVPVLNYEFHSEYVRSLKFKDKIERIQQNKYSEFIHQNNVQEVLRDLNEKLEKLQTKMNLERDQNELIIEAHRGKFIRYENHFQMMSSSSKQYISVKKVCTNTNAIGYLVEMSRIYSQDMVLKILPRYKSFQQGDLIQYSDEVKIQSLSTEFYLSVNFKDVIQE